MAAAAAAAAGAAYSVRETSADMWKNHPVLKKLTETFLTHIQSAQFFPQNFFERMMCHSAYHARPRTWICSPKSDIDDITLQLFYDKITSNLSITDKYPRLQKELQKKPLDMGQKRYLFDIGIEALDKCLTQVPIPPDVQQDLRPVRPGRAIGVKLAANPYGLEIDEAEVRLEAIFKGDGLRKNKHKAWIQGIYIALSLHNGCMFSHEEIATAFRIMQFHYSGHSKLYVEQWNQTDLEEIRSRVQELRLGLSQKTPFFPDYPGHYDLSPQAVYYELGDMVLCHNGSLLQSAPDVIAFIAAQNPCHGHRRRIQDIANAVKAGSLPHNGLPVELAIKYIQEIAKRYQETHQEELLNQASSAWDRECIEFLGTYIDQILDPLQKILFVPPSTSVKNMYQHIDHALAQLPLPFAPHTIEQFLILIRQGMGVRYAKIEEMLIQIPRSDSPEPILAALEKSLIDSPDRKSLIHSKKNVGRMIRDLRKGLEGKAPSRFGGYQETIRDVLINLLKEALDRFEKGMKAQQSLLPFVSKDDSHEKLMQEINRGCELIATHYYKTFWYASPVHAYRLTDTQLAEARTHALTAKAEFPKMLLRPSPEPIQDWTKISGIGIASLMLAPAMLRTWAIPTPKHDWEMSRLKTIITVLLDKDHRRLNDFFISTKYYNDQEFRKWTNLLPRIEKAVEQFTQPAFASLWNKMESPYQRAVAWEIEEFLEDKDCRSLNPMVALKEIQRRLAKKFRSFIPLESHILSPLMQAMRMRSLPH